MSTHFFTGLLAGLVFTVAIGAQNAFVLRQGIRHEHVLPIALICSLADLVLIAGGIGGIGLILQRHPEFFTLACRAGAVFLLATALFSARRACAGREAVVGGGQRLSRSAAILSCLGFTFLNPHVYLDTVIMLGTLGNQHGPHGRWIFAAGAITASVIWFFSLAYGAGRLAPLFRRPQTWRVFDASVALMMMGLAGGLTMRSLHP